MKKVLCAVFLTVLLSLSSVVLSSCYPKPFELYHTFDEVAKVEIVDMDGDEIQVILEIAEKTKVLEDLEALKYTKTYPPETGCKGEAFKVTYSNGDYEIIGDYNVGIYTVERDETLWHNRVFDQEEFDALIDKYLEK